MTERRPFINNLLYRLRSNKIILKSKSDILFQSLPHAGVPGSAVENRFRYVVLDEYETPYTTESFPNVYETLYTTESFPNVYETPYTTESFANVYETPYTTKSFPNVYETPYTTESFLNVYETPYTTESFPNVYETPYTTESFPHVYETPYTTESFPNVSQTVLKLMRVVGWDVVPIMVENRRFGGIYRFHRQDINYIM
jgi:hypothetical protein